MNALKSLNLLVISLIVVATFSCKKRGTSNSSLRADDEEVANFRDTVSFMGLNDLHGYIRVKDYVLDNGDQKITTKIGGFNTIQEYFRSLQALNPHSVLLDAGDVYQGTIISNYFQGLSLVDSYEKLVVTASTFGNHEFDYGEAQVEPGSKLKKSNNKQGAIKEIIDQAKFGYLSVNVMKADGSPLHDKIKKI
ncbi:MAG: metallophosphoesterase [Proteobacteria bacterium]|nr:metallophosphoesterase [Pseudomonadota bacterium]